MSAAPKQCHYLPCELNDRQILTRTASQLTTARKSDRNINLQLFDSTTCRQRRLQSPQLSQKHNVRIKSSVRNDRRTP